MGEVVRLRNGRFPPGNTANPGGRPKLTKYQRRALKSARRYSARAVKMLRDIADDPAYEARDRLRALQVLLDIGLPKWAREMREEPPVDIADVVAKLDAMSGPEEQLAYLKKITTKLEKAVEAG